VFWACYQWFERGLRCIIVINMELVVVSRKNVQLGQIQGGVCGSVRDSNFHMKMPKKVGKLTPSQFVWMRVNFILILVGRIRFIILYERWF
jgi:hypothetical protein